MQISAGRHAYHRRRSVAQEGERSFAHVSVMTTGELRATDIPGYHIGGSTRLVDLRYAVSSLYLRPHAQHGLLVAPARIPSDSSGFLQQQILLTLRIRLHDTLDWLGSGVMTSSFNLFPPAVRDHGYNLLLASPKSPDALVIGEVTHFGPGS